MKWSKIKKDFKSRFAKSLQGRVDIHVTEYTRAAMDIGRGWITLDGDLVVSVKIPSFYDDTHIYPTETMHFGQAVGAYLQMSVEKALASNDVIVSGLVFLDKRCGKRRLSDVDPDVLHPFAKILYLLRCELDGIGPTNQ